LLSNSLKCIHIYDLYTLQKRVLGKDSHRQAFQVARGLFPDFIGGAHFRLIYALPVALHALESSKFC